MSGNPFEGRKLFTAEQANAALPLVRAIVKDLAEFSREVIERRERLTVLQDGRDRNARGATCTGRARADRAGTSKRTPSDCRNTSTSCANWASSPRTVPRGLSTFRP